ncbi:MAG: DUF4893 domain-containing protein [Proteobacteria bacterium]|nr:DUF4893 domain-containing protein [Pseudomonadota bacterium]
MTRLAIVLLAGIACGSQGASLAQDAGKFALTATDAAKIAQRAQHLRDALAQASQGGRPREVAVLRTLLDAPARPLPDLAAIAGDWRCRTIKVGGLLPLTPYGFFRCRIGGRGEDGTLEKLTGSQRTAGELKRFDATAFIYTGVGFTDYVARRRYGAGPQFDEVALLMRVGEDRLRMEFPAPYYESKYNVMEFVRRR